MHRRGNTTTKLTLNVAPIRLPQAKITVGILPWKDDPDYMRTLRRGHFGTHIFVRRANTVVTVATRAESEVLGDTTEVRELYADLGLCAALIRESLIRYLYGLRKPILNFDPVEFLATGPENDLLVASMPKATAPPEWLGVRYRYEVAIRPLCFDTRSPLVAAVVNSRTAIVIDTTCGALAKAGVALTGAYVERLEPRDDSRLLPKRRLAGRVETVAAGSVMLDDSRESDTQLGLDAAYLEPRRENLTRCISALFPDQTADILTELDRRTSQTREGATLLQRVRTVIEHFAKVRLEIVPGISVDLGSTFSQGIAGAKFPPVHEAPKPTYVFDVSGGRTDVWHDRGLDQHGPYDRKTFTPTRPKVAVICQRRCRGQVEQFLHKLLEGVPSVTVKDRAPFGKGLLRKYCLERCDLEFFETVNESAHGYLDASRAAIEHSTNAGTLWNLALIQIAESFHTLHGDANPYLATKAFFSGHGVSSQEVELETIARPDSQLVFVLNNIALAMYAKMGGIPWLMKANQAIAHELVFGLGSASVGEGRLGNRERIVGITTVFTGDGNYLLENRSKAVPFSQYPDALLQSLRETVSQVRKTLNWQSRDAVRLVFHAFKPFRDIEIEVVKSVVSELGEFSVEFAFLHVVEDHPFLVFDENQQGAYDGATRHTKGRLAPSRGTFFHLGEREILLSFTGPRDVKRPTDGLPRPVILRLHRGSTFHDMTYLGRQAFAFSAHSWRSFFPASIPITVMYSELIASLLGKLSHVSRWNPDVMLGRIGRTRWFL